MFVQMELPGAPRGAECGRTPATGRRQPGACTISMQGGAVLLIGAVRVALRRPYTFIVLALMLLIIGPLTAIRTPTDIFPEIRMPVIAVAWQYTGLPPDQMAGRISTLFQRILTTAVNDIEHIEANTYPGISVVKIFSQPGVDIAAANAQVTAVSQVALRQMPAGITPRRPGDR